jgi:hypothetical protein
LQQARSGASGAYCVVVASKLRSSKEAPELAGLQQASSGEALELAALQQQANPGASGACCVAASKIQSFWSLLRVAVASKPGSFQSLLRCLPLQTKQTPNKKKKKSKHLT